MNNSTITLEKLAEFLCLQPRYITYHLAVGNLPEPIKNDGEETIFDKTAVAQKLNLDLAEPLLDLKGAAKVLGVDVETIQSLIKDKNFPLPYVKMTEKRGGVPFRFYASKLREYQQGHKPNPLEFVSNEDLYRSSCFRMDFLLEVFKAVLDTVNLPEREAAVLEFLILENMSQQTVGKHYDITGERIRQISQKAKLRTFQGLDKMKDLKKVLREKDLETRELNQENQLLRQQIAALNQVAVVEAKKVNRPWPVGEAGLSVRACNCLRFVGVKDLNELEKFSEGELLKIRNLGRNVLQEIITAVEFRGLKLRTEPADK